MTADLTADEICRLLDPDDPMRQFKHHRQRHVSKASAVDLSTAIVVSRETRSYDDQFA